MEPARRRLTFVLAGALLLLIAGVAQLAAMRDQGPTAEATVVLRIDDPGSLEIFNASIEVMEEANTVLDALQNAARLHGFTVDTQEYAGLGVMVVQIFGHRAEGPCGWVYEVDGVASTSSADAHRLSTGDDVHWFWACHG